VLIVATRPIPERRAAIRADNKHSSSSIGGIAEGAGFNAVLRAVQAQPRKFKVYEKAGTLRISVQDVKNVHAAKEAMEGVLGVPERV